MEPGTVLIFGIILVPLYALIVGWYLGEPSDRKLATLGVVYLVGLTVLLWGGLFVLTMIFKLLFF